MKKFLLATALLIAPASAGAWPASCLRDVMSRACERDLLFERKLDDLQRSIELDRAIDRRIRNLDRYLYPHPQPDPNDLMRRLDPNLCYNLSLCN